MDPKQARGYLNKNPSNLEKESKVPFQGLADIQNDPRFYKFKTHRYGIRAAARTLTVYYDTHGIKTVEGVVNRWAPRSENDTKAYIRAVCNVSGYAFDQELDFHDPLVVRNLLKGIFTQELGGNPYTDAEIDEGIYAAIGTTVPGPRVSARTKAIGTAATVTVITTQAVPYVPVLQSALEHSPTWAVGSVVVLAVVLAVAYFVRKEWLANKVRQE